MLSLVFAIVKGTFGPGAAARPPGVDWSGHHAASDARTTGLARVIVGLGVDHQLAVLHVRELVLGQRQADRRLGDGAVRERGEALGVLRGAAGEVR